MKTESTIGKLQSEATEIQYYHRQSSVGNISESLQEREADRTRVWQFKKDHVYAVSDDQGSLLEHYRYNAFGEPEIYSPQTKNKLVGTAIAKPVLWNSRRYDEQTDLYYYKYSHYKADIGRWLGRDPIEEEGGINLYAYAGNEPIGDWDEFGLVNWKHNGVIFEKNFKPWKNKPHVGVTYVVRTDAGNRIKAWYGTGRYKGVYWCHGYTFDDYLKGLSVFGGVIGLNAVDLILKDDRWKHIPCANAGTGDVVRFDDGAEVRHSGKIIHVESKWPGIPFLNEVTKFDEDKSKISSKWGARGGPRLDSFATNLKQYSGNYQCYSKEGDVDVKCKVKGDNEVWKQEWYKN